MPHPSHRAIGPCRDRANCGGATGARLDIGCVSEPEVPTATKPRRRREAARAPAASQARQRAAGLSRLKLALNGGHEHVAGAAHGLDRLWLARIDLDLAADTSDADIDAAVERLEVAVARQVEQPLAR